MTQGEAIRTFAKLAASSVDRAAVEALRRAVHQTATQPQGVPTEEWLEASLALADLDEFIAWAERVSS